MQPRVLIVCEHAAATFGGEAVLPLHYFRILRRMGVEAWLVTHERTRPELLRLLPDETSRMRFLPDTSLHRAMWHLGKALPAQVAYFTTGYVSRLANQLTARQVARAMVAELGITIVHQPIPVSPREPSLLHGLGAPLIVGPMNGNMSYPPAFARHGGFGLLDRFLRVGRAASRALHTLMPGKLRAAALLVANDRTRAALPAGARGEVIQLVENGVDLQTWFPLGTAARSGGVRFVFLGRLVDWKAVDLLLEAMAQFAPQADLALDVVGDGPMRQSLEERARELGIAGMVTFHGWKPQAECARILRGGDALVLPSLYECGGAVVLEAMATGLPVIATDWGGPADYLDETCGILVPPDSRETLIRGLAQAMERLRADPELRLKLGRAGRSKIEREYDWNAKVTAMLQIYRKFALTR